MMDLNFTHYYYILKDKKIYNVGWDEWAAWLEISRFAAEDGSYNHDRWVARTVVGDYTVSTVFLLGPIGEDENGNPFLFETMIFSHLANKSGDSEFQDYQTRSGTYDEAIVQHEEAVKLREILNRANEKQ